MKQHDWKWISIRDFRKWSAAIGPNVPTAYSSAYLSALQISTNEEIGLLVLKNAVGTTLLTLSLAKINGHISARTPYGVQGWIGQRDLSPHQHALTNFCCQFKIITLYIACKPADNPDQAPSWFNSASVYPHHSTYTWPLDHSPNQRIRLSHTSHQRAIKKWINSDSRWILRATALKPAFLALYPDFIKKRNARCLYDFSSETLEQWLEHPNCLLVGAGTADAVEAVGWYWLDTPVAHYFLFASTQEGRRHSRAIHYMAAELLYQAGASYLDLGGGIAPNDNLERFKQHFGAYRLHGWSIKAIMNNSLYTQLGGQPPSPSLHFPSYSI